MKTRMDRRGFLRLSAALAAGAVAAACAPATPVIVEKEVIKEVPVEKAVVVEKEVPKEIIKEVPVEKVVEKEVIKEVPVEKIVEKVVTPTAAAPVELTILATGEGEALRQNIQPYMDKTPGVKIEIIGVSWDGFDQKTDLMIAGGDAPALWVCAANRDFIHYASRDLLVDLTPYVDRDGYDLSDYHPVLLKAGYYGGNFMGIPGGTFTTFVLYNKDLFDEAGVDYLTQSWEDDSWTWEAFLTTAKALTQPSENSLETIWGFGGNFDIRYDHLAYGVDIFNQEDYAEANAKSSLVTSGPVKKVYQTWQDYIYRHGVMPSPEVQSAFAAVSQAGLFYSGKAAMDRGAVWSLPTSLAEIEDFEWGMAPWPVNEYDGPRTVDYVDHWVVMKQEQEAKEDAAWELLKYFGSPEAIRLGIALQSQGLSNNCTRGGMVCRMSLLPEWASMIAGRSGRPLKEIQDIVIKGLDYSHVFSSLATVQWGEVWDVAMNPELDKILLNRSTVEEAVQSMDEKINEILAQ